MTRQPTNNFRDDAPRVTGRVHAFQKDERGSAGIIFGLTLIPLVIALGSAVEYGMALRMKTQTGQALDAAALAATKAAAAAAANLKSTSACVTPSSSFNIQNSSLGAQPSSGSSDGGDKAPPCLAAVNAAAVSAASAVLSSYSSLTSKINLAPNITLSNSNGYWTTKLDYTASVRTTMMGIVGLKTISLKGTNTASLSLPSSTYVNFYLMLDNSASQGIGSTATDINNMINLTGCAFGCHSAGSSSYYYDYPKSQGIRFRIDDVRSATSSLVKSAQALQTPGAAANIAMGVYSFNNSVTTLADVTTNLATVSNAVQALDLATYDDGTQIADALTWLNTNKIKGKGTGKSASSPLEVAFIVTDGVEDGIYTGWNKVSGTPGVGLPWWGSLAGKPTSTGTISPSYCDALKANGVTVAIVYTTYVPFTGVVQYDDLIGPFAANISPNLQACASPGYFFTASNPADITTGMQQLFGKALAASILRLTN